MRIELFPELWSLTSPFPWPILLLQIRSYVEILVYFNCSYCVSQSMFGGDLIPVSETEPGFSIQHVASPITEVGTGMASSPWILLLVYQWEVDSSASRSAAGHLRSGKLEVRLSLGIWEFGSLGPRLRHVSRHGPCAEKRPTRSSRAMMYFSVWSYPNSLPNRPQGCLSERFLWCCYPLWYATCTCTTLAAAMTAIANAM